MTFSLIHGFLALSLSILISLPFSLATTNTKMCFHDGPILKEEINLGIIWYGDVSQDQKNVIGNFIESLNINKGKEPQVATWWSMVESYQEAVPDGGESAPIRVKATKQLADCSYKYGKVLTKEFLEKLAADVAKEDKDVIPVIFSSRDVTVHGLCTARCGENAKTDDDKPYIYVGNPETECPGACAWPFAKADTGPVGPILHPPNENIAADAMVMAFAASLAEVATNPLGSGFYQGRESDPVGIAMACHGIFGPGACPGNPGKVLEDPKTHGAYNAEGNNDKKFLLPALWNHKTSSCWTPLD